jgi:hypothetical protein
MLSKKDFWGISAQRWFKMRVESASSIQKADSDDSIVAFQQGLPTFSIASARSRPEALANLS